MSYRKLMIYHNHVPMNISFKDCQHRIHHAPHSWMKYMYIVIKLFILWLNEGKKFVLSVSLKKYRWQYIRTFLLRICWSDKFDNHVKFILSVRETKFLFNNNFKIIFQLQIKWLDQPSYSKYTVLRKIS